MTATTNDSTVVLDRTERHRGRKLVLTVERYTRGGLTHEIEVVRHPGAVVVLPIHQDGHMVLLRQYRYPLNETILELPAGTLEHGEDPAACAQRELAEETGFQAREWTSLGTLVPAPGFCDELQHLYVARGLTPASSIADNDEEISVVTMGRHEIESAILSGELRDAKSIALLFRAQLAALI